MFPLQCELYPIPVIRISAIGIMTQSSHETAVTTHVAVNAEGNNG